MNRIDYFNFQSQTFTASASSPNSIYPNATRINSFRFDVECGLVAIFLTTTVLNYDTSEAGIFLALDNGLTFNVAQAKNVFLSHITLINSNGTAFSPTPRNTSISFGERSAVKVPSGQSIALYMSGGANASTRLSAIANLVYIPIV